MCASAHRAIINRKAVFLSIGQFQLYAAVAAQRLLPVARVERLEFAKARGGEVLWDHLFRGQVLHDGDGARGGTVPNGHRFELRIIYG